MSTDDQNPDMQVDDIKKAGCTEIFIDKISGADKDKPELKKRYPIYGKAIHSLFGNLIAWGRSVKKLIELTGELEDRGIHFKSLIDSIDTSTPAGRFFFHVMASGV